MTLPDRATIANMAPEYGAHAGFLPGRRRDAAFPAAAPGRRKSVDLVERYYKEQGLFRTDAPEPRFDDLLELDLATVVAVDGWPEAAAGPHHPGAVPAELRQGIPRPRPKARRRSWSDWAATTVDLRRRRGGHRRDHQLHQHHEPLGDGRRRSARQEGGRAGLRVDPAVKTSLARAARVVTDTWTGRWPDAVSWRRSASTRPATAARPASATAVRCPSRWPRRSPIAT